MRKQVKFCSCYCREIQPCMLIISTDSYWNTFKLKQSVLPVHLKLASIFMIQKDWLDVCNIIEFMRIMALMDWGFWGAFFIQAVEIGDLNA